jgi:hypothetical protein
VDHVPADDADQRDDVLQSSSNLGKLAVVKDQNRLVSCASGELLFRSTDALITQLERAVVDRDARLGRQDLMWFPT